VSSAGPEIVCEDPPVLIDQFDQEHDPKDGGCLTTAATDLAMHSLAYSARMSLDQLPKRTLTQGECPICQAKHAEAGIRLTDFPSSEAGQLLQFRVFRRESRHSAVGVDWWMVKSGGSNSKRYRKRGGGVLAPERLASAPVYPRLGDGRPAFLRHRCPGYTRRPRLRDDASASSLSTPVGSEDVWRHICVTSCSG